MTQAHRLAVAARATLRAAARAAEAGEHDHARALRRFADRFFAQSDRAARLNLAR